MDLSRAIVTASLRRKRCTTLALSLPSDGSLPTEFRLFKAGWNDTENGRFLFDEQAAKSVMAAAEKWGVDLMIDLEHQALNMGTPPEPTARDARGWFRLELRPDQSLWAVSVTWTADGAQRLSDKRQRYVSPAFSVDPDTSRVTSIINVALVAIPATHETPALVAASARGHMEPKLITEALDALVAGDAEKCMELLKGIIASAAGGEPSAEDESAGDPVVEPTVVEPLAADPAAEEDKQAIIAATSRLARITGHTTLGAIVDEVEVWRASHLRLEAETVKLAKERATLELSKRKENAVTLTKLGAETPFTSGLAKGKLCQRLLDEPLEEQNVRVTALLASRGGKLSGAPVSPPTTMSAGPGGGSEPAVGDREFVTPNGVVTLSAREIQNCEQAGAKLETYAANKAIHLKARGSKE